MTRQHLLLGLAWLASVLTVYFTPFGDEVPPGVAGTLSNGHASAAVHGRGAPLERDKPEQIENSAKSHAAQLIIQARQQLRGGKKQHPYVALRCAVLLGGLDDAEIAEALAEVEATVRNPGQKSFLYACLLGRWAEKDGAAAMAYFEQHDQFEIWKKWEVRSSIVRAWAQHDPPGAWQWLEQNHARLNLSPDTKVISMAFAGLAAYDLDLAFQHLGVLNEHWFTSSFMDQGLTHPKTGALEGIAESALEDASRRVLARATALPLAERAILHQHLIEAWLTRDRLAALAWFRTQSAEDQAPLRKMIGSRLIELAPEQGADFLLETAHGQPSDGGPDFEMEGLYIWAETRPRAFEAWLRKQPPQLELDHLRETHALNIRDQDPAAAMAWAQWIQNEERRRVFLQGLEVDRQQKENQR